MVIACVAVACLVPAPAPVPPPVPEPWRSLAACESDSTWHEGDGGLGPFRGGLQFHPDTWDAFAGDHLPDDPADATPAQEIAVAEQVLDAQGWGAWPTCARKLGLIGDRDV